MFNSRSGIVDTIILKLSLKSMITRSCGYVYDYMFYLKFIGLYTFDLMLQACIV